MSSKKYGLVLPEKGRQGPTFQASRNVFGDDSDSDKETTKKPVLLRTSDNINRQAKITQEKAVTEDPTVYQYDEIYDDMVGTKQKEKNKKKEDAKPRYIENLMKSANKRKIENERRIERQIQKEREKEGAEFKDKEVFVTSAYKKKLEEMREEEEREKREEYLENIGDVTKQRDLGGFYRHIYEQKLGSEKPLTDNNKVTTNEAKKEASTSEEKSEKPSAVRKGDPATRNYRKRKSTESKTNLSEGELDDSDEEINRLNLDNIKLAKKNKAVDENIDADSDFSIDESSDEETEKKNSEEQPKETQNETEKVPKKSRTPEKEVNVKKEKDSQKMDTPKMVEEAKVKINIWEKRTVGVVFTDALKRYYERKAARGI